MTALTARISRGALEANARRAASSAGRDAIVDLRRDAYGHGLGAVARAVTGAGIRSAVLDAGVDAPGLTPRDEAATVSADALYGFPGSGGDPAMTLVGTVLSTKRLLAGEGVSYNHTHIADRDTRIALVTGGFGQGVVRAIGNGVVVQIGDALHPVVGRIAMDVCVVDVGADAVSAGDEVVFFGGGGGGGGGSVRDLLEQWRRASGLTFGEIVCTLGLRARREEAP